MNIWLWFRTGGPLLGGAIVLALNNDANAKMKGKVGYQTYLVFIALQCLAAPIALLLTPPEKVQRADGSRVIVKAEKSFKAEFVALYKVSCIILHCRLRYSDLEHRFAGDGRFSFYCQCSGLPTLISILAISRRTILEYEPEL